MFALGKLRNHSTRKKGIAKPSVELLPLSRSQDSQLTSTGQQDSSRESGDQCASQHENDIALKRIEGENEEKERESDSNFFFCRLVFSFLALFLFTTSLLSLSLSPLFFVYQNSREVETKLRHSPPPLLAK